MYKSLPQILYNIIGDFSPHISIKTDLQSPYVAFLYISILLIQNHSSMTLNLKAIKEIYIKLKLKIFCYSGGNVNITNQPNPTLVAIIFSK